MLSERLLELQEIDTAVRQAGHRRTSLPAGEVLASARAAREAWEAEEQRLDRRLAELEASITDAEAASSEIDAVRDRLRNQLRTVIAPREAEAIQRELATLDARRSELDDQGLEALEEQAAVDDELQRHRADERRVSDELQAAEASYRVELGAIDDEIEALVARRHPLRDQLNQATLERYDRLSQHLGVAVGRLIGQRCDGCHLDLSPAEIDQLKSVPEGELGACPQCDRILVR